VQAILQRGGLECAIAYDIRPHLWGKLLANASINPVAALLDAKNSIITDDPNAGELARELAIESAAVAKALRVNLPFSNAWEYVRTVLAASPDGRNSMTIDLEARMRTEVDQINGAIVAAGRRVGVPTPYNEAVLRLVKAKERAPRE
jgi:2-dehydropantoate 2-reductase